MQLAAKRAAIYSRSSKDRSDVSIDAQHRILTALAASKGLTVAATFEDVVEAANDTQRPGFQALLREIKNPQRPWSTLLVMDTARIARNVYLIEVFKQECRRTGIKLIFEKLPEINPMIDMMIQQVMQAFDQMHSMMIREKGLAGINPQLVLIDGKIPNAYAGGKLGPNRLALNFPLLSMFERDRDAIAAAMAHEMGHLAKNHYGIGQSRDVALDVLGSIIGTLIDAKGGGGLGSVIGSGGSRAASAAFDRDQEREADALAVDWLRRAGFDPGGLERLLGRLPSAGGFLSDHPATSERIDNIRRWIAAPQARAD